MDFDDEDIPKEVSKTPNIAPGSAGNPKPQPQPESTAKKAEHDVDAKFVGPNLEPEVYNGSVRMEIDSKVDKEPETTEAELMEEDQIPLQEEKDEEDVVVREIDVFFNPSIDVNAKLYVLQYPLRPSWRPYEIDERCEEVRVNPSTSQVEIDLSLDVHSKNYDSEFGKKLNMTKLTLTTTWNPLRPLDYAVGVLSGDKLHLNPVHAVPQLRPSMEHHSSKTKQVEATEDSVGTTKKQNKGVQAMTDQKPIHEDNWIALKYHGFESEICSKYLNEMMANGNFSIDFNMSPDDVIDSLCGGVNSRNSESKYPSTRVLTSLPLEERVQKLLCEGPSSMFRYSVLKHYAPELSDEDFLRVLQRNAWLVQGLWTPKTRLLKLDGPLQASRDYVLNLFSKAITIPYSEVEATGRLKEKMKTMLNVFARERPLLRDWKLKEPTDASFIKSYPEIVKEQEIFWKDMDEKLRPMITKGGKSRADSSKNPPVTVKPEIPTTLSDKGSSLQVRQRMSEDIRRAIPKALKKVFQTHKVCRYETICQGVRDLAVSASNNPKADSGMAQQVALAVDIHREEFQQVISEVTVDIHGSFVSKSSPDHPEYDPLRRVVIDLLRRSIPGTKLRKADVCGAGKTELGREITNNEYIKVMHDLCEKTSTGWVLQKAR